MDLDTILRCPRCHGPLEHRAKCYACAACRVAYPIEDGVPSFVPSDATPLAPDDDAKR